jgi:hypothetical protein
VILTHLGGLYRCALRDIVRVTGFAAATPVVEYSCRSGLVSVAGERLRESHVLRAMADARAAAGGSIRNLAYRARPGDGGVPGHEAAVAFDGPRSGRELRAFGDALDAALAREAPAYAGARRAGTLVAPLVRPVPPEAFLREWCRRVEDGERPPRVKDRVFRDDPEFWTRLTAPAETPVHTGGSDVRHG